MNTPKLKGIDHFHLYVDDKQQAVDWYQKMLGFRVVDSMLMWNEGNGPLTIEDTSGKIHLALFKRTDQAPCTSIAFAATGKEFLNWQEYLTHYDLNLRIADHQITWSMYFKDPFENMHEITTSEYNYVAERIKNR